MTTRRRTPMPIFRISFHISAIISTIRLPNVIQNTMPFSTTLHHRNSDRRLSLQGSFEDTHALSTIAWGLYGRASKCGIRATSVNKPNIRKERGLTIIQCTYFKRRNRKELGRASIDPFPVPTSARMSLFLCMVRTRNWC